MFPLMFSFDTVFNIKTKYPISITDSNIHQFKKIIYKEISNENYLCCIYENFSPR